MGSSREEKKLGMEQKKQRLCPKVQSQGGSMGPSLLWRAGIASEHPNMCLATLLSIHSFSTSTKSQIPLHTLIDTLTFMSVQEDTHTHPHTHPVVNTVISVTLTHQACPRSERNLRWVHPLNVKSLSLSLSLGLNQIPGTCRA